jgi:hypothetical protein
MEKKNTGLVKETLTIQEWQAATRPNIYRNRKKYTRKNKHGNETV